MSLDIQKYKTQLEEMLVEITEAVEGVKRADPASSELRDVDNNMEDDYSESEEGFRANELIDDLTEKRDLIVAALKKIDNGTYGLDVDTGEPINPKRLDAVPYATHTIGHAREIESEIG